MKNTTTNLTDPGLVEDCEWSPWLVDHTEETRSVVVYPSGYALSPRAGRLPVAPAVVELYRHRSEPAPVAVRVADTGDCPDDWRLRFVLAPGADTTTLASAPLEGGAER